jgi:hypothetical protein
MTVSMKLSILSISILAIIQNSAKNKAPCYNDTHNTDTPLNENQHNIMKNKNL